MLEKLAKQAYMVYLIMLALWPFCSGAAFGEEAHTPESRNFLSTTPLC